MNRTLILWVAAFVITAASAWFQRVTGPTYPLSGSAHLGGSPVTYRLERSHGGDSDAPVSLRVPDTSVAGLLEWRRHGTDDPWTAAGMDREGALLRGRLPHQPPSGKLEYRVRLREGTESVVLPEGSFAVMRFKGDVPAPLLVVHILCMFTGMLFSTRTGLSVFFRGEEGIGSGLLPTIALLGAGGLVLGPLVQKYAFDAYWTGWPFGTDLTDNKTVAALAAWVAVALIHRRVRRPSYWALAAAFITLAIFMIPHSLLGSELDYRKLDAPGRTAPRSVSFFAPVRTDERAPDGRGHC
jgi:hypothetical protein